MSKIKIFLAEIDDAETLKDISLSAFKVNFEKYEEITKWFLVTPYKDFRNHYFYEKLGYKKVGEFRPDENSDFNLFQYEKEIKYP